MLTMTTLRDYLRERGHASLTEMALHFDAAPSAVEGVLDQWSNRGRVRALLAGESCCRKGSGCSSSCKVEEIYAWIDAASGKA